METIEWGLLVVNYLFLAGISAGAFAISSLGTLVGGPHFRRVARIGAMIAPWPASLGVALLVLDLGRPLAAFRLFMTVQYTSPMSIGAWLLTGFVLIAFVYAAFWLPAPLDTFLRLPRRGADVLHFSRWQPLTQATIRGGRRLVAVVGFPVALGIGIYTGVLLGAVPARPFWNTPMLAQLFLFSAMSTGTAAVLLVTALVGTQKASGYEAERRLLVSADVVLIVLEVFMLVPFLLHHALSPWSSATSIGLILGGDFTPWFWLGTIALGIVLPLLIETYELFPVVLHRVAERYGLALSAASSVLVLIGGFVLRYVFVYAGQASHFLPVVAR